VGAPYGERVSLRARLLAILALLVLVLAATTAVTATAQRRVARENSLVGEVLQPAAVEARALLSAMVNQETGQRGFLITGDTSYLAPYRQGREAAMARLAELRTSFRSDPDVQRALDAVARAQREWRTRHADPEIEARRSGGLPAAQTLVDSGGGRRSFDALRRRIEALQQLIDERTEVARADALRDGQVARNAVVVGAAVTLLLVLLTGLLVRRWFLVPVNRLRGDMRAVAAGALEREIRASGPSDVAAIGHDAEGMRRRIVSELDTARAASEALAQHSPVVLGLRDELAVPPDQRTPGLVVHGALSPAEGVLAGDWWEVVTRPDGVSVLVVADVSGHGAGAGLVALRFKHRLTTALQTPLALGDAFAVAAQNLDPDPERFISCVLVALDPGSGRLEWLNAGHPPVLVMSRQRGQVSSRQLPPTGPLVSAVTSRWTVESTAIDRRHVVVALTDGVLDARDVRGEEFGVSGVLTAAAGARRWVPRDVVDSCLDSVRRFAADWWRDDITCVALALAAPTGAGTGEASAEGSVEQRSRGQSGVSPAPEPVDWCNGDKHNHSVTEHDRDHGPAGTSRSVRAGDDGSSSPVWDDAPLPLRSGAGRVAARPLSPLRDHAARLLSRAADPSLG
jgi:sigma-B regulation protein RsbU (phosphoserine phosphatase)